METNSSCSTILYLQLDINSPQKKSLSVINSDTTVLIYVYRKRAMSMMTSCHLPLVYLPFCLSVSVSQPRNLRQAMGTSFWNLTNSSKTLQKTNFKASKSAVALANQTKERPVLMNFSQGHSGTKVQCESCLFSLRKNTRIHKNGRDSWTFRFSPFFGLVCQGDSWANGYQNAGKSQSTVKKVRATCRRQNAWRS